MTNEWGAPIPGDEMKALKGRIDPAQLTCFLEDVGTEIIQYIKLPANHPYYKVREHNQTHSPNLVLHDGSAKVPEDWAPGIIMSRRGNVVSLGCDDAEIMLWYHNNSPSDIIAYTPKPKESEMPSDEAIEYVLREFSRGVTVEHVLANPVNYLMVLAHARLIQQYELDRLKPAVDVAAGNYTRDIHGHVADTIQRAFKAGAAWQKENGK